MDTLIRKLQVVLLLILPDKKNDDKPDHAVDGILNRVDKDLIQDAEVNNPVKDVSMPLVYLEWIQNAELLKVGR